MKNLEIKSLVFLVMFAIAAFVYTKIEHAAELRKEREKRSKLIKEVKEQKESEKKEVIRKRDSIIESLQIQIGQVSREAAELAQKIKTYEKRPKMDIDFIAAHRIIANSRYQSEQ